MLRIKKKPEKHEMSEKKTESSWGPNNPHPLSKIKTELVWEGKYDEFGNRREIEIAACAMPLQKVETIDEPRSNAEGSGQLELFEKKSKRLDDFRNMLVWGDNKLVMASLLEQFKGKIDLIYIDPPFDVGADFTMNVPIGDEDDTIEKEQSALEMVAYKDTWGKGSNSYMHMIYERFLIIKELLNERGSVYVHCDYRVNSMIRLILDEIFGRDSLINEVIWCYRDRANRKEHWNQKHDTLYWYSKNAGNFTFNIDNVRTPYRPEYVIKFKYEDEKGKYYIRGKNIKGSPVRLKDGLTPDVESKYPDLTFRQYLEDGSPPLDWWEMPILNKAANERTGYATQKPEQLVERIISASSNEGDLVADFFCGSGTTGAVAEKLGRRWILCDLGRFAIHTTRKRMIEIQRKLYSEEKPYRAFDVYNLGRYERQWWQKDRLKGMEEEHRRIVLAFYRAEALSNPVSPFLHGKKGAAIVSVDGIDSILTFTELKGIVESANLAGARELHCLAWEFEMELKRNAEALEHEFGIKIKLIRIPREVMEKNRRPGIDNVPFFEMATLSAETIIRIEGGVRIADVRLTNFLPSLSEASSKELEALKERAIRNGFDFIDFWALDFDHKDNQPFRHHWQDYRLRKDRSLKLESDCGHRYEDNLQHKICVKVIDTFGCDTSIILEVPGGGVKRKKN